MGNKVKFIAPVSLWSLVGTADTNAPAKTASNIEAGSKSPTRQSQRYGDGA
jgi:hypothetical protein